MASENEDMACMTALAGTGGSATAAPSATVVPTASTGATTAPSSHRQGAPQSPAALESLDEPAVKPTPSPQCVLTAESLVITVAPMPATRKGYAILQYTIQVIAVGATAAQQRVQYVEGLADIMGDSDTWTRPLTSTLALVRPDSGSVTCLLKGMIDPAAVADEQDEAAVDNSLSVTHTLSALYAQHRADADADHDADSDCECEEYGAHQYRKPTLPALWAWYAGSIVRPQLSELLSASLVLGKARAIAGEKDPVSFDPLTLDAVMPACGHAMSRSMHARLLRARDAASCPLCRMLIQNNVMSLWV